MKKILALSGLLVAVCLACGFVSCSDTTEEIDPVKNIAVRLDGSAAGSSIYRTILPESWTYGTDPKAASLYYALTAFMISDPTEDDGTIPSGEEQYTIDVTYGDLTSSKGVSFSLRPGDWRVILSAYSESPSGTAESVQLEDGTYEYYARGATNCIFTDAKAIALDADTDFDSLVFNLVSVTNDSAAKGTISLSFTMYPPNMFKTVSWFISEYGDTLTAIAGTSDSYEVGSDDFSGIFTSVANGVIGYSTYYYTSAPITQEMTPGTYWFVLSFADKNGKRMLTYPILVVVDGDNNSSGDVILRKALFSSAPLSASDLSLEYVTYSGYSVGSEDTAVRDTAVALAPAVDWGTRLSNNLYEEFTALPDSTYTFRFGLHHTWSDNADNETGYHYILTDNNSNDANASTIAEAVLPAGSSSLTSTVDVAYSTDSSLLDYTFSVRAENSFSTTDNSTTDDGFDKWQTITGTKVFMLFYQLTDGIQVAYSASASTGASVAYFGVPYVIEEAEDIDLLSSGGSYPAIENLPTGKTLLGWQVNGSGTTITTLTKEASGVNVILTPVFSE